MRICRFCVKYPFKNVIPAHTSTPLVERTDSPASKQTLWSPCSCVGLVGMSKRKYKSFDTFSKGINLEMAYLFLNIILG